MALIAAVRAAVEASEAITTAEEWLKLKKN